MEGAPESVRSSRADEQLVREGAITQCCIAADAACMLHLRSGHYPPADALRRTAFLDVSSLNLGGAKSAAVFFRPRSGHPVKSKSSARPPSGRRWIWCDMFGFASGQGRQRLPIRNRRHATPGGSIIRTPPASTAGGRSRLGRITGMERQRAAGGLPERQGHRREKDRRNRRDAARPR
jgi:hypothetical protein